MKRFKDDLNTAVITTRFVLEEQSPILFVFHFEDGFWQFSGCEKELSDEDYKLVSLDEIIKLDPTILEVSDIPYNKEAYRNNISSDWVIRDSNH
ncbi:MAG: hypothetical protein M9904_18435 [Chitinophagaceae bacterium]|nr:hypothetical protein [Chitinophagaceae bacterium]